MLSIKSSKLTRKVDWHSAKAVIGDVQPWKKLKVYPLDETKIDPSDGTAPDVDVKIIIKNAVRITRYKGLFVHDGMVRIRDQ